MDDLFAPYGAEDARADAARVCKATAAEAADIVYEIRNRLRATEGCRRPGIDIDYIDASDALVIADGLVKSGAFVRSDLRRLAVELDAAATALDELITNKKPKKRTKTPLRNQTRTADQIWPERNRSK